MKSKESPDGPEGRKADPQRRETLEVYAVERGRSGWTLSRRDLLSAAAAAVAAVAVSRRAEAAGCPAGALAHTQSVESIAISPDGGLLASGDDDNTIKLWSLAGGALLKTLAPSTR